MKKQNKNTTTTALAIPQSEHQQVFTPPARLPDLIQALALQEWNRVQGLKAEAKRELDQIESERDELLQAIANDALVGKFRDDRTAKSKAEVKYDGDLEVTIELGDPTLKRELARYQDRIQGIKTPTFRYNLNLRWRDSVDDEAKVLPALRKAIASQIQQERFAGILKSPEALKVLDRMNQQISGRALRAGSIEVES